MKKTLLIIFIFSLMVPTNIFAQTASPNDEKEKSTSDKLESKVDLIKDKVASRVAELKLVEKRGIVGVVESVDDNEIKIIDLNDKTRIIETDELTKFTSEENSFELADIKKGTKISAIGLYNKDSEKLLARFVNEISIPLFLNGVISNKNDEEFTLTLTTEDEKEYIVDIEKITKSFTFNDGELETAGFTKFDTLKNALVIGYQDPKDENRITANRIIIFPDVPKNPRIEIENSIEITPSKSTTKSPSPTPNDE